MYKNYFTKLELSQNTRGYHRNDWINSRIFYANFNAFCSPNSNMVMKIWISILSKVKNKILSWCLHAISAEGGKLRCIVIQMILVDGFLLMDKMNKSRYRLSDFSFILIVTAMEYSKYNSNGFRMRPETLTKCCLMF